MKKITFVEKSKKNITSEDLDLPMFSDELSKTLDKGELLKVDGTNVVRVPFGIRRPRKQRPERAENWATLVLPLQPAGTPTPPPHAA